MQGFVIALLTCSITMSALALFYMAITPLLGKRYSPKGRYYAWLIVVIGLIIPIRPHFNNAIVRVDIPRETVMPVIQVGNGTPVALPIENVVPQVNAIEFSSFSIWQFIAFAWLAGAVLLIAYHAIKHYRFIKLAVRWSESVTDEQTLTLFQDTKNEMGISKNIGLLSCVSIGSPMMLGLITPRILLPKTDFAKDELRFILKHELVHYKRKDLWYKCLVLLATAIHWFNPIVYLLARAIDAQCELSCDDEVVRSADTDTRQHYSETIIGVVKYRSKLKTALSTNFYGGKKGMKNRISSIMDTTKKKTGFTILCIALVLTMGTGIAFAAGTQTEANSSFRLPFFWLSEQNRKNDTERIFAEYSKYNLVYNKETDRLYFNGDFVRYFEDIESDSYYKKWPFQDGEVDVYAVRNASRELVGVEAFSQQAFDERTPLLDNAVYALQITNSITKTQTITDKQTEYKSSPGDNGSQNANYTAGMEQVKREALEQAYEIYKQYGLTYDKNNDSLSYNGKSVSYFEDEALFRFFGSLEAGEIEIYAIRDDAGKLTGLEVRE